MLEKIGTVKNPLTIIAMFAAITEIGGTVVLPFIADSLQHIYLWFLILFPSALVVLFFITLNLNTHVLYAPSDFKNEDNFIKSFSKATPEERKYKIASELRENEKEKIDNDTETVNNIEGSNDATEKYYLAESLLMRKIESEYPSGIVRDIKYQVSNSDTSMLFDGVSHQGNTYNAIEVKYFPSSVLRVTSSVNKLYNEALQVKKDLEEKGKHLKITLVIGVDDLSGKPLIAFRQKIAQTIKQYGIHSEIKAFNVTELRKEFGIQ